MYVERGKEPLRDHLETFRFQRMTGWLQYIYLSSHNHLLLLSHSTKVLLSSKWERFSFFICGTKTKKLKNTESHKWQTLHSILLRFRTREQSYLIKFRNTNSILCSKISAEWSTNKVSLLRKNNYFLIFIPTQILIKSSRWSFSSLLRSSV